MTDEQAPVVKKKGYRPADPKVIVFSLSVFNHRFWITDKKGIGIRGKGSKQAFKTTNVKTSEWQLIMEKFASMPDIKNGVVFAAPDYETGKKIALERHAEIQKRRARGG